MTSPDSPSTLSDEPPTPFRRRAPRGWSAILREAILTALFAAVSVSMQPLLWNAYLFLAGLPDVLLVSQVAAWWWWRQLPVVFPHLCAAVLLCVTATVLSRLVLHRTRPWVRQVVSTAAAGLLLSAVLTHWYYDSVGGTETTAGVAGLFVVYAVVSVPWMWMAQLLAEPRALTATPPVPR